MEKGDRKKETGIYSLVLFFASCKYLYFILSSFVFSGLSRLGHCAISIGLWAKYLDQSETRSLDQ